MTNRLSETWKLFLLLVSVGLVLTFFHDYAYRRADVTGTGDYEFGGLISHAGTDIMAATLVLAAAAVLWTSLRGRSQ